MKNILFIEDNDAIIKGLVYLLEQENYNVTVSKTKENSILLLKNNYDLAIIDVNLPDGNGFDLVKNLKNKDIPFIFLTARDLEDDVVKGLELGAVDYIVKPFRSRELLIKISRILKNDDTIKVGNVLINLSSAKVYVDDELVNFTALEYKILLLLFSNVNKVITREVLLNKIWDIAGNYVNDNTLTVYIKRIRKKLNNDMIKTLKGIGYRVDTK